MENHYEILKIKQEITVREDLAPLNPSSSYNFALWLQNEIGNDTQENLVVFCLDTRNKVNSYSVVFRGGLNQSIAIPKDILQRALLSNAESIIIAHNHPSNNPTPSESDKRFTCRMKECCELVGIRLLDHIIVGYDTYFSFLEQKLLKE